MAKMILVFVLGAVLGWIAGRVAVSVRRRRRVIAERRHATMELAALVGGLAHEIRNPLSTLKVNLELLGEDWRDAFEGESDPDLPRRSLVRLETLVAEASRLDHTLDAFMRLVGRHELALSRCDLNELLRELVAFFEPQAREDGIQIRLTTESSALECMIDRELIHQALLNLLINARQAMPDGGELIIRSMRQEGGLARVDIADTGCGMDSTVVERIWQPYYSTKPGGSGLGLPTTRRIVSEHGGTIDLASHPGQGASFTVRLPLAL